MQLGQLHQIEAELEELGYRILAVSPDRSEKLQESVGKNDLKYQLISDSKMELSQGFGLAYKVDDAMQKVLEGYGIDIEAASGEKHRLLPVPGVFLIGKDGIVDFSYVNPDYSVRLSSDVILAAAKANATE